MAKSLKTETKETEEAIEALRDAIKGVNGEIPKFTDGLKAGLTAVAEKLPDVVDSMIKLNAQNKELAAAGGKPKSVLSQLAGSMFSWNTVISVGITLLMTYGEELFNWIEGLIKGEKKLSAFAKAMKDAKIVSEALIETQLQGRKSAQAELTSLNLLYRASQNHTLSTILSASLSAVALAC